MCFQASGLAACTAPPLGKSSEIVLVRTSSDMSFWTRISPGDCLGPLLGAAAFAAASFSCLSCCCAVRARADKQSETQQEGHQHYTHTHGEEGQSKSQRAPTPLLEPSREGGKKEKNAQREAQSSREETHTNPAVWLFFPRLIVPPETKTCFSRRRGARAARLAQQLSGCLKHYTYHDDDAARPRKKTKQKTQGGRRVIERAGPS